MPTDSYGNNVTYNSNGSVTYSASASNSAAAQARTVASLSPAQMSAALASMARNGISEEQALTNAPYTQEQMVRFYGADEASRRMGAGYNNSSLSIVPDMGPLGRPEWNDPATGAKTPAGVGMPTSTATTGTHIANEAELQAKRQELTKAGVPQADWGKYISSPNAQGKIYWNQPATLTSPTGEKRVVAVGSPEATQLLGQSWTLGDKVGGGTVTSGLLTPTTPINIGGDTTKTANDAGIIQAGADATSKAVDEEIKRLTELQTPPPSSLSKEVQALMDELKAGADTLTGRGAAQKAAEQQQGIAEKQAALAAKNSELKTKLAEIKSLDASYQLANQTEEGRTQTLSRLQGAQAQNYKMYLAQRNTLTADAGYMQAELLGMQGQLDSAQAAADRAVDLEYTDRESAYNAKIAKLNILQPQLAKEEARYAAALKSVLEGQADAVAEEKQNKKDLMSTIIQAAGNGAPASIISQMKAAPDVLTATTIANKWLKGTLETATKAGASGSGSGTGSGSSTNRTALFKAVGLSQYPTAFQNFIKGQNDSWLSGLNSKTLSQEFERFKSNPQSSNPDQATTDMTSQLSGVTGGDGFVSPDDWLTARNAWIDAGLNPTTFDTKFKGFKNPNNKNYSTDKKTKGSSSGSLSDEEFIKLLDQ